MMLSIFSYVSVCLPQRSVCSSPLPIFLIGLFDFLEWSRVQFFIYFGDHTLVQRIICKYIFPYGWFPINIADFSLAMQKLCILMKSHLFILSFMSLALGDILVKILLGGISEIFLPKCSSRTFMVS